MLRACALSLSAVAALFTMAAPAHATPMNEPNYVSKRVVLDPATGKVLSITDVDERISQRHYCNGHDACYLASGVPYADHGFYGSAGTKNGNWPNRRGYYTGAYFAKFCWNGNICSAELPPRHEVFYPNGQIVTGSSVSIR